MSFPSPHKIPRAEIRNAEGHIIDQLGGNPRRYFDGFTSWVTGPPDLSDRLIVIRRSPGHPLERPEPCIRHNTKGVYEDILLDAWDLQSVGWERYRSRIKRKLLDDEQFFRGCFLQALAMYPDRGYNDARVQVEIKIKKYQINVTSVGFPHWDRKSRRGNPLAERVDNWPKQHGKEYPDYEGIGTILFQFTVAFPRNRGRVCFHLQMELPLKKSELPRRGKWQLGNSAGQGRDYASHIASRLDVYYPHAKLDQAR